MTEDAVHSRAVHGRATSITVRLAATIALFLFFYPILAALPVPARLFFHEILPGVRTWTWFPTWV